MKSTDNNKNKENTFLTDDELDKVAGGVIDQDSSGLYPCRCDNRVVQKKQKQKIVYYICGNCGGYIKVK